MKKVYVNPQASVSKFQLEDIITASSSEPAAPTDISASVAWDSDSSDIVDIFKE